MALRLPFFRGTDDFPAVPRRPISVVAMMVTLSITPLDTFATKHHNNKIGEI